jgi:hypothetical protein
MVLMSTAPPSTSIPDSADFAGQLLDPKCQTAAAEAAPISVEQLTTVIHIAQEMFGVEPVFEVLADPEEPDCAFVLFTVTANGTPEQLVERQLEWHQKLRPLFKQPFDVPRLRIIPA